jgi:hypothetical protein
MLGETSSHGFNCKLASVERDPENSLMLVQEICRLLKGKEPDARERSGAAHLNRDRMPPCRPARRSTLRKSQPRSLRPALNAATRSRLQGCADSLPGKCAARDATRPSMEA